MARFRLDSIAALARQMAFTPSETRVAQVASAEGLLHDLDPAKAYPYDFVVFRVTGYRPKTAGDESLLTGVALQHDLGQLIESVSATLKMSVGEVDQPVLSIEDVASRFNVSDKTIQRWRRKGLPARRFLFGDGKNRVGFLLSSIERFVARHTADVATASNFSQVDEGERVEIFRRARRLAGECHCCQSEIARRIGKKLHRSPLTILHTIKKHDADYPAAAIFPHAAGPLSEEMRGKVARWHRRGISLDRIAGKIGSTRGAVARVVLDERLSRLGRKRVSFIDDPFFHQPDAQGMIDQLVEQETLPTAEAAAEVSRLGELPGYLKELCRPGLLGPAQERALFLQLNYRKYLFVTARRKLDESTIRSRDLARLEKLLSDITQTKNRIVRHNLRLVVAVARKHLRPAVALTELISDGSITLMRAVDSFDIQRGNRFSTYATLALMKGFARSVPAMQVAARRTSESSERSLDLVEDTRSFGDRGVSEELSTLLSRLNRQERVILLAQFGMEATIPPTPLVRALTHNQLAKRLHITPHRVRQIRHEALEKLRAGAK